MSMNNYRLMMKGIKVSFDTDCICTRNVDSSGSTFDIVELFFRFIVFAVETLEMVGEEGRFRRSVSL